MAIELNITADNKFFLGDDKTWELQVFGQDNVTPLNVSGIPLQWSLRKKDKDPDPPIMRKGNGIAPVVATGITVVGVYDANPAVNTQRVRITFASNDTDPLVTSVLQTNPYTLKPNVNYRHSLKRMDVGDEGILNYGNWMFLQATER